LINALTGTPSAVDAPTIDNALKAMPKPLPVPLQSGLTFQCGKKLVAMLPSACVSDVVSYTLDAQGNQTNPKVIAVSS
jgi:hypothetical protein